MSKPRRWTVPGWMRPLVRLIGDTGGNDVEDLVNDHTTTIVENAPRAMICVAVKDQVILLSRLHAEGLLKEEPQ